MSIHNCMGSIQRLIFSAWKYDICKAYLLVDVNIMEASIKKLKCDTNRE